MKNRKVIVAAACMQVEHNKKSNLEKHREFTEEAGNEEPQGLAMDATAAGDRWVLEGRKLFVPDAASADPLVVVAVPVDKALDVIRDCAAKKVKGVVLVPGGFGEIGESGQRLLPRRRRNGRQMTRLTQADSDNRSMYG